MVAKSLSEYARSQAEAQSSESEGEQLGGALVYLRGSGAELVDAESVTVEFGGVEQVSAS